MRKQELAEGNGDAATAAGENGHHFRRVCRVTALPSNAHVRETADGVEVLVTTPDRGTFRLRKRNDRPGSRCPLLRYEIRRIDEDVPQPDEPPRPTPRIGNPSEEGTGRQAAPPTAVLDAPRHPH